MSTQTKGENTKKPTEPNKCNDPSNYTVNIIEDRVNKKPYKFPEDTSAFKHHCDRLGWPSDIIKPTGKVAHFMNAPIEDTTGKCFIDNTHHIEFTKGDHTCYLNRRCEKGNKEFDYTCYSSYNKSSGDKLSGGKSSKNVPAPNCVANGPPKIANSMNELTSFSAKDSGYTRCKQGYVVEPVVLSKDTPLAYGGWDCQSKKWKYKGGQGSDDTDDNDDDEWTGKCIPDSCPDITIPDSKEYSFNPVHGKYGDKEIMVECNDGYSFNHDLLHKGGFINCDYDLMNKGDNPWERNTMGLVRYR